MTSMTKIKLRELSTFSKIEIFGHEFNGLDDIKKVVETYCRIGSDPWNTEPKTPVENIHVTCIHEPYPCFDVEDYANEDRDYSNYFFSPVPLTHHQIIRLSKLSRKCNAQIVSDAMPEWAVPALYYCGEGNKMIMAIIQ